MFIDGRLGFGLDCAEYDFDDRISLTTAPQVVAIDFANFLEMYPQVDPLNPDLADSQLWVDNFQDPVILRVPGANTFV